MSYIVTAPLVIAADPEGALKYHYEGAEIEYLSEVDAERFIEDGMVEEIAPRSVAPAREDEDGGHDGPPPKTATKDAWVDYAESKGMPRDEADALSKADLIQALG